MSSTGIAILFFLASTALAYGIGYINGFESAVDQMKKVRNRK